MKVDRINHETHIDPVCGMEVQPQEAAGTSTVGGKTYYFCAKSCKEQFDANPSRYTKATSS